MEIFKCKWKWRLTIGLFWISITNPVNSQVSNYDCNDPVLLENHMDRTYCAHACGYDLLGVPDTSVCTATGDCICNFPCEVLALPPSDPPDICLNPIGPPDPDPDTQTRCADTCAAACPDAAPAICSNDIPQGLDMMTFSYICTCFCMPMPCTTTTTPAPTTTTPSSVNNNNNFGGILGLIASSLAISGVKGSAFKFVLKLVIVLGKLFIKVSALYVVKSALVILYTVLLYAWFESQYGRLFGFVRNEIEGFIGPVFRTLGDDDDN